MSTQFQNLYKYKCGPNFKIPAKFLNHMLRHPGEWGSRFPFCISFIFVTAIFVMKYRLTDCKLKYQYHHWWASFWTDFLLLTPGLYIVYWHNPIYPRQLLLSTIVPMPLVSCEWQLEHNTNSGREFVHKGEFYPSFKASVKITVRISNLNLFLIHLMGGTIFQRLSINSQSESRQVRHQQVTGHDNDRKATRSSCCWCKAPSLYILQCWSFENISCSIRTLYWW